jgi:hypothetical protein
VVATNNRDNAAAGERAPPPDAHSVTACARAWAAGGGNQRDAHMQLRGALGVEEGRRAAGGGAVGGRGARGRRRIELGAQHPSAAPPCHRRPKACCAPDKGAAKPAERRPAASRHRGAARLLPLPPRASAPAGHRAKLPRRRLARAARQGYVVARSKGKGVCVCVWGRRRPHLRLAARVRRSGGATKMRTRPAPTTVAGPAPAADGGQLQQCDVTRHAIGAPNG